MFRRLQEFCALWLVAQILLPFTAPFPTCDLSDLLSSTRHDHAPLVPSNPRVEGDYAFAPPLATTAGRLRLVVVSTLDLSSVLGIRGAIAPGQPSADAFGGRQRSLQIHPTILRL